MDVINGREIFLIVFMIVIYNCCNMGLGLYIYFIGVLISLAYSIYLVRDEETKLIELSDSLYCILFSLTSWIFFLAMLVGQRLRTLDTGTDIDESKDTDNTFLK